MSSCTPTTTAAPPTARTRGRLARASIALASWALLAVTAACGGGSGEGETGAATEKSTGPAARLPISAPTGPVDPELAEKGERLFRTRGCISCHTIGEGRRVGPDLAGIAERREFAWTYHMVTNPDSMLKNDSIAERLLGEYMVPMADQKVTPEQFRALYEYVRSEGGGGDVSASPDGAGTDEAADGPGTAGRRSRHRTCCRHSN